jgi:mono/diheme cytochrome c family protein
MLERIVIAVAGVGVLCLLGFLVLAWRPVIDPIDPPAGTTFPAEMIAKGEVLAGAGYCAVCHTRPGGQPYWRQPAEGKPLFCKGRHGTIVVFLKIVAKTLWSVPVFMDVFWYW